MLQIIQNDPEVPPGNLIDHLTIPYHVHHPYRDSQLPAMADISALIVMGGSMGANDDQQHPFLRNLKDLIRTVVAARIPYLGICLGDNCWRRRWGRRLLPTGGKKWGLCHSSSRRMALKIVFLAASPGSLPLSSGTMTALTFPIAGSCWHHHRSAPTRRSG